MFGNKKGDEINAGEKLDDVEQKQIEGAYGSSELRLERRPIIPGMRVLLMVGFIAIMIVPVALSWRAFKMRNTVKVEEEKPQQTVQQVIPSYNPIIEEKPKVIEEPERLAQTEEEEETQTLPSSLAQLLQTTLPPQLIKDSEELARKRMLSSGLNSGGSSEGSADNSKNNTSSDRDVGILSDRLQPIRLSPSYAAQLRNRDLLITQGTQIDCILETRIITTQPGMTTCYLTRDVYSTSGRVVLLDRGSKVIGFYQGGLQQGQARIFVQWSRVETPSGVIVNLDSPGTGPLGESGIGGWIDGHFWERFSGAIMISIIGNFGEWVKNKMNKESPQDKPQPHNFQNAESMVTDVLQNSINIVPTLYKNQGERVNILVARDLDFSDVYSLTTR
ncbi:type IV secretion system protein VirB10 [Bartonella sp. CB60]|uniref:type IV secretion system protein VirB10 n=1 Tax=Bartonella sp. CB60 TaxID=3113619 RepID=UPI00300E318D